MKAKPGFSFRDYMIAPPPIPNYDGKAEAIIYNSGKLNAKAVAFPREHVGLVPVTKAHRLVKQAGNSAGSRAGFVPKGKRVEPVLVEPVEPVARPARLHKVVKRRVHKPFAVDGWKF